MPGLASAAGLASRRHCLQQTEAAGLGNQRAGQRCFLTAQVNPQISMEAGKTLPMICPQPVHGSAVLLGRAECHLVLLDRGEPHRAATSSSRLAASNSEASRGTPAFLPLRLGPSYLSMHGICVCHSQIRGLTGQVGFLLWMWALSFHLFPCALIYFPGGCLGPQHCSARAGHLSHQCFLAPHVREVVLGDVAEILCLHFLFLFLLASPRQACALPARTALCALFWSISGHLYFIKDGKDWVFLIADFRQGDIPCAWVCPGAGVAVPGEARQLSVRLLRPSQRSGWPMLLRNILPFGWQGCGVGLGAG